MSVRTPGWLRAWAIRPRACRAALPSIPSTTSTHWALSSCPPSSSSARSSASRLFSGILIGWAKPTPVISRNFAKIRRDENLVTLAGPASNLVLAVLATLCSWSSSTLRREAARSSTSHLHGALLPEASAFDTGNRPARHRCRRNQPGALLLQPAADSAARRQPAAAQHAALQRRADLRPHSHLGQLDSDDLCRRLHHAPAPCPGFRSGRSSSSVTDKRGAACASAAATINPASR